MNKIHYTYKKQFQQSRINNVNFIFQDDQQYLIEEAHLQKLITPQWKNSGKGKTTTQLVAEYYSQLTKKQIMQLYDIYR